MHGKYAFARIETVTERRRLRRLFLRFSFPIVDTLLAVVVTKARLRQKLASLPLCKLYENATFSAWLCKHFPAFGMLFVLHRLFLRFSFADCMHLAGGCRNEGEITAKTRWLYPFANCTKKQLFRRGYASIFLLLSGSLFCTVFFALEECFLFVGNGFKRLRNLQTSTCFFYFRQKRCYWLFCTFVLGKFSLHYIYF